MADKPRTPKPPRPNQGPKRREDPRKRPNSRLLVLGLVAAIGLALLIGLFVLLGGDEEKTSVTAPGCQVQTFPEMPADHVQELAADYKYNSTPPTSGLHHPTTTLWGFYEEPTADIHNVHNLEHGGIVVSYDPDLPAAEVAELRQWWQDDPNGIVVTPRAGQAGVAAAAWARLLTCENLDAEALSDFRDDRRGKGPEQFPVDALVPGQN